jgi:cation diffusion facilitator CzcD-associated flavoprotein CzcO
MTLTTLTTLTTVTSRTYDQDLDVAVIGGGQAGLAMAWHLRRMGLRFAVLDAGGQIGSAWRSRWDSLRLCTPARYDALPGPRRRQPLQRSRQARC